MLCQLPLLKGSAAYNWRGTLRGCHIAQWQSGTASASITAQEDFMNRTCRMLTATLTVAAASFALQGTALAGVTVGVNVGVPSFYYGAGYYPPGPCDAYSYYYEGDCGYPVFSGRVFVNGVWVTGPHYYRWYNGRPLFWHRGGWHYWNGWHGARWN